MVQAGEFYYTVKTKTVEDAKSLADRITELKETINHDEKIDFGITEISADVQDYDDGEPYVELRLEVENTEFEFIPGEPMVRYTANGDGYPGSDGYIEGLIEANDVTETVKAQIEQMGFKDTFIDIEDYELDDEEDMYAKAEYEEQAAYEDYCDRAYDEWRDRQFEDRDYPD